MKKRNTQKGFTIIELVVVILLLGILTATALPRFMDVTDDAHTAVVSAVVGGLGTGTGMFKAQWFAKNQPRSVSAFNNLAANRSGYPVGLKTGSGATVLRTIGTSAHCKEIFENLLQAGGQPTITAKTESSSVITTSGLTVPSGYDFVSFLVTTDSASKNECYYIYTGQYTDNTLYTLPYIKYNAKTGAITQSSI